MSIGETSGESGPQQLLVEAEAELRLLDERRSELVARIERLRHEATALPPTVSEVSSSYLTAPVTQYSSEAEKIRLFRALFRACEDVCPKRFESVRTGRSGYQPDCANEWIRDLCAKPRIKCKDCPNRQLIPVTDDAIRCHLMGHTPGSRRGLTIGVYPLLSDDTCWFLAADFGNLIALPLQKTPRAQGNSVFVDHGLRPYPPAA